MRRAMAVLVIVAAAAAACSPERTIRPGDGSEGPPPVFSYPSPGTCSSVGNAQGTAGSHHWAKWVDGSSVQHNVFPCGANVVVQNEGGVAQLSNAIGIWNVVLQEHGLPTLALSGGPSDPRIIVRMVGEGDFACGVTKLHLNAAPVISDTIFIYRSTLPNNCYDGPNSRTVVYSNGNELKKLIAHEIGHAIGFLGHFILGDEYDGEEHVKYCVNVVPPNLAVPLNGTVCQHEKSIIYYGYGLQGEDPSLAKHFVMGLVVSPLTVGLDLNASAAASVEEMQVRTQEGFDVATPGAGDLITWSLDISPPSSWTLDATTGTPNTVRSTSVVGSGTAVADLTSSTTYNIGWPFIRGSISLSINGPTGVPSALGISGVTGSAAQLTWANGDPASSTKVEYRVVGAGSWTTATTAAPGVGTYGLSGLSSCTSYDTQLRHQRNTILSSPYTVANAIHTTGGGTACAPSNFHFTQCTWYTQGGTTYRTYHVGWTQGDFTFKSRYQIGQTSTSNPAGATIVRNGMSPTVADSLGPYPQQPGAPTAYFWVRHTLNGGGGPSAWVALADGPIQLGQPC